MTPLFLSCYLTEKEPPLELVHLVFSASAGPLTRAPVDPNVRDGRFVLREHALSLDMPWAERVFLEATR